VPVNAENTFLLFKERRPFILKKEYPSEQWQVISCRLIPLKAPVSFRWTVPLRKHFQTRLLNLHYYIRSFIDFNCDQSSPRRHVCNAKWHLGNLLWGIIDTAGIVSVVSLSLTKFTWLRCRGFHSDIDTKQIVSGISRLPAPRKLFVSKLIIHVLKVRHYNNWFGIITYHRRTRMKV
jgi:hypothetical protein